MAAALRVGNCSGFYGDRLAAMREMLEGGPLDVLTGDYLAELTMLILYRSRLRDPAAGFAATFLRQLEDCLGLARERQVRLVANAGGLNPAGCADAVRALAERLGVPVRVAHVAGDDLLERAGELGLDQHGAPVTANAYLGGWGIAAALEHGAEVVVTGRTTDAALVAGPAAWHHGWRREDWDALAGAVVAGHVLECGAQATGGNYAFFGELDDVTHPGFPVAEIAADGSCVITKHPGTGGAVTVGTVTAQLLYEIGGPRYLGPDVTTRFDTIRLEPAGPDRVRVSGVRGEPPPPTTKVCLNRIGGLRNSVTFLLTGLDAAAKAQLVRRQLEPVLRRVREHEIFLAVTTDEDPDSNERALSTLRVTVRDDDPALVGRAFSGAAVELALASYPGFAMTGPPGEASPYGVYAAAYVPAEAVHQVVVLDTGERLPVDPVLAQPAPAPAPPPAVAAPPGGPTRRVPLGRLAGARSGDKGGDANLGVWVRDEDAYAWLASYLTVETFQLLLPETKDLEVTRYELPNLRALNFVVTGLLGEGVAASARTDPQAKGLGEWLRARLVEVPEALLGEPG